ncbi:MAG: D-alanyl-D-alanine carboxypeptidase family protein [Actinotalea sp.]|nr:D-alanyl-D-alanine carboxypeptidase family protein [Actinotalea sp.]
MTHEDGAPLTRRALRMQAAAAVDAPSTSSGPEASPATARPLTRRELRLAAAAAALAGDDVPVTAVSGPVLPLRPVAPPADPVPATPVPTTPAPTTPVTPAAGERPLTRREIRLREQARAAAAAARGASPDQVATACRPPFTASLVLTAPVEQDAPAAVVTPARADDAPLVPAAGSRPGHATGHLVDQPVRSVPRPAARPRSRPEPGGRGAFAHVARKPVAVVALSAGLLTLGITQVHAEQGVVAQAEAAVAAALAETERRDRVETAATERLTAQAAAYAAERRAEALSTAEEVVAAAHGAKEIAAPVLDPEKVAALEAAAAELAAMLEAAPDPALETLMGTEADLTDDEARVEQPSRSVPAEGREPLDETAPALDAEPAAGDGTEAAEPVDGEQAADADPAGPETVPAAGAPTPEAAASAAGVPTAALVEALPDLDIEVSRRIQERAEEVAALTAEIQGLADAAIAEAEAAAAAEEQARLEAEAAAAAAAAELARKVEVAKNARNGEIPTDVLCGVGFDTGVKLRCDAAAALEQLNAAYRADFGRDLDVVSSYRSYSQQVAVRRTRGSLAAPPGMSNHGLGVAVDFANFGGLGNFSTANYRWMRANADRFGWYHPRVMQPGGGGPQEPWHWEFGTDS